MTEPYTLEHLYFLAFDGILLGWVLWLAKKKGFFVLPPARTEIPVYFKQLALAFGSYLFLALVLLPVIFILSAIWFHQLPFKEFSLVTKGILQELILLTIFLWLILYSYLIQARTRRFIYANEERRTFKQMMRSAFMGVIALIISYPIMVAVNLLIASLSYLIFHQKSVDQVAVQQLKGFLGNPFLFSTMLFTVSVIVPFIEEVLFRGFLQNWLLTKLSRKWAILLTALIFAMVHFSTLQGTTNLELICSLFVLSCFLGYIYERERTLIAPVVMHGTFNFLSALMIALTSSS